MLEQKVMKHVDVLKKLNEVATIANVEPKETLREALNIGRDYLNLPFGIVSNIVNNTYRISVQSSPKDTLTDDMEFDLGVTYCSITLDASDVVYIDDMGNSEYNTHPCFEAFKLATYIGAPVIVNKKLYGTINFSSPEKHSEDFYETDIDFVRLLAKLAGTFLEKQIYLEKLTSSNDMLDEAQKIAQLGSWTLDNQTNTLEWSNEIYRLFEVETDEVKPSYERFLNIIHPNDVDRVNQSFTESIENKSSYDVTHRLLMKDGRIKFVREQGHTDYNEQGEATLTHGTVQDITSLHMAQAERERYLSLVDEHVITSSTDLRGKITYVSQAFSDISGYDKDELMGRNHSIVRHPDMSEELYEELWSTILNDQTWVGEIKNLKKDGSSYWVKATISPVFSEENKKIGYTAIRQDITDKKRVEELAIRDSLTQLYNRVHLDLILLQSIQNSSRFGHQLSVIMLDIDKFKNVNDTYGHQVGDSVLKETSDILKKLIRESDTLGRWGGEEFLVIAPETDIDGAMILAENIRLKMMNHNFSTIGTVTASFGVSCFQKDDTENTIVDRADKALYKAKENGRNQVST